MRCGGGWSRAFTFWSHIQSELKCLQTTASEALSKRSECPSTVGVSKIITCRGGCRSANLGSKLQVNRTSKAQGQGICRSLGKLLSPSPQKGLFVCFNLGDSLLKKRRQRTPFFGEQKEGEAGNGTVPGSGQWVGEVPKPTEARILLRRGYVHRFWGSWRISLRLETGDS